MKIYANSAARSVAEPFCAEAVKIINEAGCLENPESPFFRHFVPLKAKMFSCGIYAIFRNGKVVKIGSTSNLARCFQNYKDNDDDDSSDDQFYDAVGLDVDGKLQVVYDKFMSAMLPA